MHTKTKNKIDTAHEKDAIRVSGKADQEVETVQARMKKEGIKLSAKTIREFIKKFGHLRTTLYKLLRIHNAIKGLTYMSESDHGFEVIAVKDYREITGENRKVETVTLDRFFEGRELGNLRAVLETELQDLEVYRVSDGGADIDVYVTGRLKRGRFAGVKTKAIET